MKETEYIDRFKNQLPEIDLLPDEKLTQCLDKTSFDGKFYQPQWAISNKARVWSIQYEKWLVPLPWGNNDRYWRVDSYRSGEITHIKISQLVANYYCDKTAVALFGESNVDIHHDMPFVTSDEIQHCDDGTVKREHCMAVNSANNLHYQEKDDHKDVHRLMNGHTSFGINEIDQNDHFLYNLVEGLSDTDEKSVYFEYREDGKKILHIKVGFHFNDLNCDRD